MSDQKTKSTLIKASKLARPASGGKLNIKSKRDSTYQTFDKHYPIDRSIRPTSKDGRK